MMLLAICATFRFHRTPTALAACPYRALQQHCKKKTPKKRLFSARASTSKFPRRIPGVPASSHVPKVVAARVWGGGERPTAAPAPYSQTQWFSPRSHPLCALPVGSPPKVVRILRVQAFLVSLGPRKGTCAGSFFCFRCFPPVSALSVRSTSLRGSLKFVLRS